MDFMDISEETPGSGKHIFAGDIHWGNAEVSIEKCEKLKQKVRSMKNCTVSFGGDNTESILPFDKRFSLRTHTELDYLKGASENDELSPENRRCKGTLNRIDEQIAGFVDFFEPLADKTLWVISGNHEDKFEYLTDIAVRIGRGLGTFGTPSWTIKADFGCFRVLDWHGSGSVESHANDEDLIYGLEARSVKKKLYRMPGDDCHAMIMHHIHKNRLKRPTESLNMIGMDELQGVYLPAGAKIPVRGGYIIPKNARWYASSGCLMKGYATGYSTYIEKRGYKAVEHGFIVAEWKNDEFIGLQEMKI